VASCLVPVLSGCERDPVRVERGRPLALVQGVVVAGADSVFVRASRMKVSGREGPLPGASLTLAGPGDRETPLEEVGGGACGMPTEVTCYRGPLPASLGTGDRIGVIGTLPESGAVEGGALVPPAPEVLDSAGRRLTPGDTLRTALQPLLYYPVARIPLEVLSPDTHLPSRNYPVEVWLDREGTLAEGCVARVRFRIPPGSTDGVPTLQIDEPLCPGPSHGEGWYAATLRLLFLRYDRAFADYLEANLSLDPLPAVMGSVNVTGVHGALGAATPLEVTVRIFSGAGPAGA
jgi:hypothetical protein